MIAVAGYEVRFNRVRTIVFISGAGETRHRTLSVAAATDPNTELSFGVRIPAAVVAAIKEATK